MYKLIILISLFFFFQSLPQTPAGGVGGKGSGSAGTGSGMVNGSGTDHQDIRDGAAINTEHVSNLSINKKILSFLSTRKFHKLRERSQR